MASKRAEPVLFSAQLPAGSPEELTDALDYDFWEPVGELPVTDVLRDRLSILDNGFVEYGYRALPVDQLYTYFRNWEPKLVAAPDREFDFRYNWGAGKMLSKLVPRKQILITITAMSPLMQRIQAKLVRLGGFGGIALHRNNNRSALKTRGHLHLFGIRWPENLWHFRHRAKATVTIDSVKPIVAAIYGWSFPEGGFASFPRPEGYLEHQLTEQETQLALRNIFWMKLEIQRRVENSPELMIKGTWKRRNQIKECTGGEPVSQAK